jgi:hypothetical protein
MLDEPAIIFDKESLRVLKIGNRDSVIKELNKRTESCLLTGLDLLDNYVYLDLPKDADLLNAITNSSVALRKFITDNGLLEILSN